MIDWPDYSIMLAKRPFLAVIIYLEISDLPIEVGAGLGSVRARYIRSMMAHPQTFLDV